VIGRDVGGLDAGYDVLRVHWEFVPTCQSMAVLVKQARLCRASPVFVLPAGLARVATTSARLFDLTLLAILNLADCERSTDEERLRQRGATFPEFAVLPDRRGERDRHHSRSVAKGTSAEWPSR